MITNLQESIIHDIQNLKTIDSTLLKLVIHICRFSCSL